MQLPAMCSSSPLWAVPFTTSSRSSQSTKPSATLDPPVPLPGTAILRNTLFLLSSAISFSAAVAFCIKACTCATVTVGGRLFLKFNTSAIRTLLKPPFSGIGSNICPRAYLMTCATWDKSVVKLATIPWSSNRSLRRSSSLGGGGSGFERERWTGLRRLKEANEEDEERLRRGFWLLDFVIREEWAAESWRGILVEGTVDGFRCEGTAEHGEQCKRW